MFPRRKKANLKKFLGNLKVHFKTKSAPMVDGKPLNRIYNSNGFCHKVKDS